MSNLITLTCPSCGGRLEVTNNTERYVCAHCGNEHLVDPGVRAESLAKEVDDLKSVSGILRLKDEIEVLEHRRSELDQQIGKPRKLQDQNDTLVGLVFIGSIFIALVFIANAIGHLISQEYLFAMGHALAALAAFGVAWLTKRGRFTIIYPQASDIVLKELVQIDRQLAAKRRDLDQRQRTSDVISV
jgi:DNA-directed RNA polymerase subunit RPC12/RpoP